MQHCYYYFGGLSKIKIHKAIGVDFQPATLTCGFHPSPATATGLYGKVSSTGNGPCNGNRDRNRIVHVRNVNSMDFLWCCIVFGFALITSIEPVRGTAEVLSHVTAHFGRSLEECREESGLTKEVMEEFKHFWSEDFEVVHRELGCALICMSNKFSLLQDDARMHHMNMHDYILSFPSGDVLSTKMVNMIHKCEQQYDGVVDDCSRVVKVAACFKKDAKKEGIAPEVTMIEAVLEKYKQGEPSS
ncbi:unnamed protein product, partial [Iphiclides podalirius]